MGLASGCLPPGMGSFLVAPTAAMALRSAGGTMGLAMPHSRVCHKG